MKKITRKTMISLFIALIMILNIMPLGLISKVYADGEIKIDSIRISGITTPTAGAMPVFSCVIPTGEHYSLFYTGVQWLDISDSTTMNSTDTFEAGKSYRMEICFVPDEGYYFEDANTITATIDGIDGSEYSTSIYPAGGGTYPNRSVYFNFKPLPAADKYTVSFDANGGTGAMPNVEVDAGEKYVLPENEFTPPDGYEFERWNKGAVGSSITINYNTTIKAIWREIKDPAITCSSVSIEIQEPQIGQTPKYTYKLPEGVHYTISDSGVRWYNITDSKWMESTDVFEIKKAYRAEICFMTNNGYCFNYYYSMSASLVGVDSSKYTTSIAPAGGDPYPNRVVYFNFKAKCLNSHNLVEIPAKAATCTETGNNLYYKCNECGKLFKDAEGTVETTIEDETIEKTVHTPKAAVKENEHEATCTKEGSYDEVIYCSVCGEELSREHKNIAKTTNHTWYDGYIINEPTCKFPGLKNYTCKVCGEIKQEEVKKLEHKFVIDLTKATQKENGYIIEECYECGMVKSNPTIPKIQTISLSKTSFTYNNKIQKPTVKVKDSKGNVISASNYIVKYSNNSSKKIGEYKVTITFKGNYEGTKTLKYTINPKGTSLKKLTAGNKQFKATWKAQKTETTGYELQYATNKAFTSGKKKITIKKNKTTSSTVKKLKAKKKYYVRIRTYKTVNGKKYYSGWSKVLNVKTK